MLRAKWQRAREKKREKEIYIYIYIYVCVQLFDDIVCERAGREDNIFGPLKI